MSEAIEVKAQNGDGGRMDAQIRSPDTSTNSHHSLKSLKTGDSTSVTPKFLSRYCQESEAKSARKLQSPDTTKADDSSKDDKNDSERSPKKYARERKEGEPSRFSSSKLRELESQLSGTKTSEQKYTYSGRDYISPGTRENEPFSSLRYRTSDEGSYRKSNYTKPGEYRLKYSENISPEGYKSISLKSDYSNRMLRKTTDPIPYIVKYGGDLEKGSKPIPSSSPNTEPRSSLGLGVTSTTYTPNTKPYLQENYFTKHHEPVIRTPLQTKRYEDALGGGYITRSESPGLRSYTPKYESETPHKIPYSSKLNFGSPSSTDFETETYRKPYSTKFDKNIDYTPTKPGLKQNIADNDSFMETAYTSPIRATYTLRGKNEEKTDTVTKEYPKTKMDESFERIRASRKKSPEKELDDTTYLKQVQRNASKSPVAFARRSSPVSKNGGDDSGYSVREPGRCVGSGFVTEPAELSADTGYLLWTHPKGTLDMVIRYGETGEDFSCFIDPQFRGVKVYEVQTKFRKKLIVDGQEDPLLSTNPCHKLTPTRPKPENNFELESRDGQVQLHLEAIRTPTKETSKQHQLPFKISYTLAL